MVTIKDKEFFVKEKTIVAIGNFDGFHYGHLELIKKLNNEKNKSNSSLVNISNKENLHKLFNNDSSIAFGNSQELLGYPFKSVVFSFTPHPLSFIEKKEMKTILTLNEKIKELKKLNIDYFVNYPFDEEVMNMRAEYFIKEILVKKLNLKKLIIGDGFKFGKNNEGNINLLKSLSLKYKFELIVVPQKNQNNKKISSSLIRELIESGNLKDVKPLLGKHYYIKGVVINGKRLGRLLKFPTANILPNKNKLVPKNGVYITTTKIDGKLYESISNIGFNPTTDGLKHKILETHILDYDEDLYGKVIKVNFLEFIRGEKAFKNLDALKEQIAIDCKVAIDFFNNRD